MDNRVIDIQSEGYGDFQLAMKLAFGGRKTTIGYRIYQNGICLYWSESEKMISLPYQMNLDQATEFCWGWLLANKPTAKEPDHDGDNGKGFKVYNEAWGHVFSEWQAFVAIEPIWAMYGK